MSYSIKYGDIEFLIEEGSLGIRKQKSQQVRHYPGTDKSDVAFLGRGATVITCTIIARSDTERVLAEQLLHDDTERTFEYHNFYYKKVVPGAEPSFDPIMPNRKMWLIRAEFHALDPIPYDAETEERLY